MMRLVSTDLDSETGEPRLAEAGVQPELPSMRILSPQSRMAPVSTIVEFQCGTQNLAHFNDWEKLADKNSPTSQD
jgi:hypothetical protein